LLFRQRAIAPENVIRLAPAGFGFHPRSDLGILDVTSAELRFWGRPRFGAYGRGGTGGDHGRRLHSRPVIATCKNIMAPAKCLNPAFALSRRCSWCGGICPGGREPASARPARANQSSGRGKGIHQFCGPISASV
jgi:hypothetical protein